jgi:acetolactate synthase-1/3 small subunit
MIVEASGNQEKVESFIELLRPLGVHEITRTGRIAIGRLSGGNGEDAVTESDEGVLAVAT